MAAKRIILPGYLSRAGSVPVAGYRSMLAFWLGGACSYPYIKPPEPEPKPPGGGGGGPGYWPHGKKKRRPERPRNDDDEVALLVATAWVTVWDR